MSTSQNNDADTHRDPSASETPRTDAAAVVGCMTRPQHGVTDDFARTLERELQQCRTKLAEVERERDEWKKSAIQSAGLDETFPPTSLYDRIRFKHLETRLQNSEAVRAELAGWLEKIEALQPEPIEDPFPPDWQEQIKNCPECQGWCKTHPLMHGICDEHRKPFYRREKREAQSADLLPYRMKEIARAALARHRAAPSEKKEAEQSYTTDEINDLYEQGKLPGCRERAAPSGQDAKEAQP